MNNQQQQLHQTSVLTPTKSTSLEQASDKIEPVVIIATTAQPHLIEQNGQPEAALVKTDKSMSESDLMRLRKINFKRKVSGKEKRVRQNRKLYRMLTPRNAIAALNELHGQSVTESTVVPTQGNKFEAEITINNVKFIGTGNSKMQAKNSASEKALREIVINKFQQIKNHEMSNPSVDSEDITLDDDKTEDVPMMQLASFALHKLYAEWEAEGFEIPLPKPEVVSSASNGSVVDAKQTSPKAPKVRMDLPPNNSTMHPVMLLSIMRPCTQYSDLGSQGQTPNIMHTVGCTLDGQNFIGQGRSKKEARKRVATEILVKLFQWKGTSS